MKAKVLSILALLLTVTQGAWAQWTGGTYTATATENLGAITVNGDATLTINSDVTVTVTGGINVTSGTLTVKGPGTLVVNGKAGSNGYSDGPENGGPGGPGGVAISGNIIVQGGATVKATGGNGGNGGNSEAETGGNGAQGGAAITGEVTIQDASTLEATGGNGGSGGGTEVGRVGNGANGANAIGGTLNYKGGTVTANGGNGGSGGWSEMDEEYGPSGSAGKAFTTSVNFVSSDYILTDGSNAITATQVTSKKKVVISPKVAVNSVTLAPTSATLTLGETETVTLIPTVLPDDATDKTVTWTTSNASVATVADGVVTAVAPGTATITATATNGTADTSDDKTATCEVTVTDPATKYDLTLADGSDAHGTVAFTVGGAAATQAKKDDVVTVSVTPAEGYSAKDVTVRAYTSWEAANARRLSAPALQDNVDVTKQENGTWTFTMPEANVWVVVTYTKDVQDAWIQSIADQTYTGEALTPAVVVKDGETTLAENTDYTVAYSNNVNTGTATVTVTGTGNYSGTATATFIIRADKSGLNEAITAAEAYYESIKDSNPTAAAALKTAIDAAKAVKDNADASQTDVNNALSALTTAKTTAEQTVLEETKTALGDDIAEAEAYYESIKDSNPEAAAALQTAIDAAQAVKDNADATQAEVEAAIAALASAKTTAEQTVLTETKNELNDAIDEAEAYYNSIKDSNPAAAATLLEAINAAKAVKNNADATQEQVETAIQTLTDALNAAKADVALKRITLVIPAKSYMARIDADKRQIENDVAGVKLYSVKNVADSEVELTGELTVIAAEMPYFIYNDNDTEVEVSIVVSSEDADNVDYDSEHFKGTLVDKTFTDEDMEEYDHYVLSNGHDFVWVKDAGVLAAGKCWIELSKSESAGARRLTIVHEGEATGISTAKTDADNKDAAVYDLQGRRVSKTAKGLYIVNGKKVVIK